jgi:hypothetical protein
LEQIRFETVIQGGRVELVSLKANAFKGSLEANGKWDGTLSTPMLSLQGHFKNFAVEPKVQVGSFFYTQIDRDGSIALESGGIFAAVGASPHERTSPVEDSERAIDRV